MRGAVSLAGFRASMAEPATSLPDIAVGNVVGSNTAEILGIPSITALVRPIRIPRWFAQIQIWVRTAAALVVIAAIVARRRFG